SWTILAPGRRTEQLDAHGNITHLLTVDDPHREIEIVVSGIVETTGDERPLPHQGALSPLAYLYRTPLTQPDEAIAELGRRCVPRPTATREHLLALAEAVCERVKYCSGATTVEDPAATVLARGQGVCQDQAHLFIACCRACGVPARYVSGYLYTGEAESDAASHAWVDAWIEAQRAWLTIDVTHRQLTDTRHCRLAVGRDYLDAAPVRGVRRGGGREALEVSVRLSGASQQ
ncbi:MAG: transglutaminase-like domain-containing protein, partial [Steroidobacteraceae bacterium]